jgi:hypothetical protein
MVTLYHGTRITSFGMQLQVLVSSPYGRKHVLLSTLPALSMKPASALRELHRVHTISYLQALLT